MNTLKITLLIALLSALTVKYLSAGSLSPVDDGSIILKSCPDSKTETDLDVGRTFENCADGGTAAEGYLSQVDLIQGVEDMVAKDINGLYRCKICRDPKVGCDDSLTMSGFTDTHCTYTFFQTDCDGDGDLDIRQTMECSTNDFEWTFSCSACD